MVAMVTDMLHTQVTIDIKAMQDAGSAIFVTSIPYSIEHQTKQIHQTKSISMVINSALKSITLIR